MENVEKEVETRLGPVEIYRATDASAVFEGLDRGWRNTVVGVNSVDSFRYSRSDSADNEGFEKLRNWINSFTEESNSTQTSGSALKTSSRIGVGAYGYIGYDMAKELEQIEKDTVRDYSLPDIAFDLYDTVVTFDDSVNVVGVEHESQSDTPEERVSQTIDLIQGFSVSNSKPTFSAERTESNFGREDYREAVNTVKEYIREGDTFQANISQRLAFGFEEEIEPIELYERLREVNPAPYMGLLDYDDYSIISSSPELLVRKKDGFLTTRPIAGTRPRGGNSESDDELRDELETSEKERAEHSILVDLVRNDLGGVSKHGTVEVEDFMKVEPYAEVQHLESVVKGEIRDNADVIDVIESMFPGGTVTGAPKPRTLEIIEEVEPTERGPYTGSMGWIQWDPNPDFDFNILIRTVVRDGRNFYLQVGGGVVHDSVPGKEYEETLQKAKGSLKAIDGEYGREDQKDREETDGGGED